jgi:hypothetical protein
MLATSPKLDALLIHVPDVFRGEIGECVVDVLQKVVEVADVCGIEVLSVLGVEIPRPGHMDLRMGLLKPVDPVRTWDNATKVEYKGVYAILVKRHRNRCLVADPIHERCFLWFGKNLLIHVCLLLVHASM